MQERVEIFHERIDPSEQLIVFGGVQMPKYLITRSTLESKMARIDELMENVRKELAKGTPTEDAGDTHGQYHNEFAWYREQQIIMTADFATENLGNGLDKAIIVGNYDIVRQVLLEAGVKPKDKVTISSRVRIVYGGDPDDFEDITLVAPLDGGAQPGWVSILTPLAKAIEAKAVGEIGEFKVDSRTIQVKVISLT